MRRPHTTWIVLAGALGASGCANLPDIAGEQCGNHIVDANEDCEPRDANDTTCGQPGTPGACQFACTGAAGSCPDARFACGIDGICRRPAVAWSAPASLGGGLATHVAIADFDGDGQGDLLSVLPPAVDVSYFDATGALLAQSSVLTSGANPAVGDLTTDYACAAIPPSMSPPALGWDATTASTGPGVASFTLDVSDGLGVVSGTETGALQPAVFTSVLLPFYETARPISVFPQHPPFPNFTLLMIMSGDPTKPPDPNAVPAPYLLNGGASRVASFPGVDAAHPVAGLAVGKFSDAQHVPDPACDLFVAAVANATEVRAYQICTGTSANPALTDASYEGKPIALPTGGRVCPTCEVSRGASEAVLGPGALHLYDQNHDGLPDLVISGTIPDPKDATKTTAALFVAYATGDGSFESKPGAADGAAAPYLDAASLSDASHAAYTAGIDAAPLVVADLNGDCVLDFVNVHGIWLSQGGGPAASCKGVDVPVLPPPPAPTIFYLPNDLTTNAELTAAAVLDWNGDGRPDLVTGAQTLAGMTAYLGTPEGLLNPFKIDTVGGVKNFAVGDFNGDLLDDLAFAQVGEQDPVTGSTPDTVSVAFGAAAGGPSAPVDLGVIGDTTELVRVDQLQISDDTASELWAVSQTPGAAAKGLPAKISLFIGNGDEQLEAPYFVITESGSSSPGLPDIPQVSAVGQLDDCAHGDVALIGTAPPTPMMMSGMGQAAAPHLWILPSRGDAQIHTIGLANHDTAPLGEPVYVTIPAEFGPQGKSPASPNALLLTVNLGPNPGTPTDTDEIVAVSTVDCAALTSSSVSTALVAKRSAATATSATWALDNVGMTPFAGDPLPGFVVPASLGHIGGEMIRADVDGDGKDDVVVVSATSGLLVVHNDGSTRLALDKVATLGLESLGGPPSSTADPCKAGVDALLGVAPIQVDAGAAKQLVVVRKTGAYLVRRGSDGKLVATPFQSKYGSLAGIDVAVGDVNGDRIDDLILAEAHAPPVVLLGLALEPGGQPSQKAPAVVLPSGGAP